MAEEITEERKKSRYKAGIPFPAARPGVGVGLNMPDDRIRMKFALLNENGDMITDQRTPLLIFNINPANLDEAHSANIQRTQTRGGYYETHWPDNLTGLSASNTSGNFWFPRVGLSTRFRTMTMAYERMMSFVDLYKNNGMFYDERGRPTMRGQVRVIYDGNIYDGFFENLTLKEDAEKPFSWAFDWNFRVERTLAKFLRH